MAKAIKQWTWQVAGQVVTAKYNRWTGMTTVAVDGEPLTKKRRWTFTTKIPLVLRGTTDAILIVRVRLSRKRRLALEVEGRAVEPVSVPRLSTPQRIAVATLASIYLGLVALAIAPWILGGWNVPNPRWAEADLAPMPPEHENAWVPLLNGVAIPDAGDRPLLDASQRIPADQTQTAKRELARPDVVALLASVPDVLRRRSFAAPRDDPSRRVLELVDWRYWLALSVSQRMAEEPELPADVLSQTITMWVECANRATDTVLYFACATRAERDLILLEQSLDYLGNNPERRAAIEAAAEESATLSPENVLRASYLESYEFLAQAISELHLFVDKQRTIATFNELVDHTTQNTRCNNLPPFDLWKTLYRYNHGGTLFARIAANSYCHAFEAATNATKQVTTARTQLLTTLQEHEAKATN
ncbi:MAG: hypothetical protein AAGF92_02075 [Myxococcota bacterium]